MASKSVGKGVALLAAALAVACLVFAITHSLGADRDQQLEEQLPPEPKDALGSTQETASAAVVAPATSSAQTPVTPATESPAHEAVESEANNSDRREAVGTTQVLKLLTVDAATGEPIPGLRLTIGKGANREKPQANSQGALVTRMRHGLKDQRRWVDSEPGHPESVDREVAELELIRSEEASQTKQAHSVRLSIGPTYSLVLDQTLAPEMLRPGGAIGRVVGKTSEGDAFDAGWRSLRPAREGFNESFWLRYNRPLVEEGVILTDLQVEVRAANWPLTQRRASWIVGPEAVPDAGPPLVQKNASPSGPLYHNGANRLSGSAALSSYVGIHPGSVAVACKTELGLSGRVVDLEGQPVAGLRITTVHENADWQTTSGGSWSGQTNKDGTFLAFPLRPGTHSLVGLSREYERITESVELWPGSQSVGDLIARPLVISGDLSGSVTISGGRIDHIAAVRLRSLGDHGFDKVEFVTLSQSGEDTEQAAQGSYRFQGLPSGKYEVSLITVPDLPMEPRSHVATPPQDELNFQVDGIAEGFMVGFEVYDDSTGEPIENFKALFDIGGRHLPTTRRCTFGGTEWKIADGSRLSWWIEAEGYAIASGDERAFTTIGSRGSGESEDEPHLAQVRLQPAWSTMLLFRDATQLMDSFFEDEIDDELAIFSSPPIRGVRILGDGHQIGASDNLGFASISQDKEPDQLEFSAPGWRLFRANVLQGGKLSRRRSPAVIWMIR